jgi:hypothetical protein
LCSEQKLCQDDNELAQEMPGKKSSLFPSAKSLNLRLKVVSRDNDQAFMSSGSSPQRLGIEETKLAHKLKGKYDEGYRC